jgi:hypothetical protein
MEIKRIGVVSAAKIVGALYFSLGLIMGFFFACAGLLGLAAEASSEFADTSSVFFLVFACATPIVYGVIGAIMGAIGAAIYNVVAGVIGGLEIEFSEANVE